MENRTGSRETDKVWNVLERQKPSPEESPDEKRIDELSPEERALLRMRVLPLGKKDHIYFAHTYRRLNRDVGRQVSYILLLVVPVILLLLLFYPALTKAFSQLCADVLEQSRVGGTSGALGISSIEFLPVFGDVYYVVASTKLPYPDFVLANLAVSLGLILLFAATKGKLAMPLSIYALFALLVQTASCIFFLFAPADFPYDGTSYSMLYMEQQMGIWISFALIAGIVTGLISHAGLARRLLVFWLIMLYSVVFGFARYVTFLFVVTSFSSVYMAALYFAFGPFFDFLYLVFIYGLFVDKSIRRFSGRDVGEDVWRWA